MKSLIKNLFVRLIVIIIMGTPCMKGVEVEKRPAYHYSVGEYLEEYLGFKYYRVTDLNLDTIQKRYNITFYFIAGDYISMNCLSEG